MAGILSITLPSPLPRLPTTTTASSSSTTKHTNRFLSSLSTSTNSDHLIRKFLLSSSKSTSLHTLSTLLSQSSPLSYPMYKRLTTTPWFKFSPSLAADLISLLKSHSHSSADSLLSESLSQLNSPKQLCLFYCHLIDSAFNRNLKSLALHSYSQLKQIPHAKRKLYESMIKGLSSTDSPIDAEAMLHEMRLNGFTPSGFEYRVVIQAYGRLGLFNEMRRVVKEMEGYGIGVDVVCANVILSCYGDRNELGEMVRWIGMMKGLSVGLDTRTFNTVLNSCAGLVTMLDDVESLPVSVEELVARLEEGSLNEAVLVKELVGCFSVLGWCGLEGKLDLHGFHLASAYVVLLQWMEEMRVWFRGDEVVVPMEIEVVCGWGKHSVVRGESPVRKMVAKMMARLGSPMKVDGRNVGRFLAKGKAVKDWLC